MKIPLLKIKYDDNDLMSIKKVMERGNDWAIGPEIEQFEKKLAKYVGTKYALAFNSGTSALHATLLSLCFGEGYEVIVPSFTFAATANVVELVGAKTVFADIEEDTLGLDPEDVLRKITDKTKAIIAVHYAGCPCKIQELKRIADDYGLFLIEDACEALGAKIGNKMVGTFGNIAVFSFCQNKIITTGEGGAIVTNHKAIYEKIKLYRGHGKLKGDIVLPGYNYRIPTMSAALGISQLDKLENNIASRIKIAKFLMEKLSTGERFPDNYKHVYQLLSFRFENRDRVKKFLAGKGIETRVYFDPIHLSTFYRNKYKKVNLPITEKVSKEILSLPIYPDLTDKEMEYMAEQIWKIIY
jgi:perosamine synthetase